MNRLVPDRPVLARVRRHVGALPHGLPTALLFTAAVAALLFGSFVVVDQALPVLMRPDAAQARDGFDRSTAKSPQGAPRVVAPATTATAWPVAASPRPAPTTAPSTRAEAAAGPPPTGSSNARTVSFRHGAESPIPTAGLGGGGEEPATPEPIPSPSPSPRAVEDDGQGRIAEPTETPGPTSRPSSEPTATPRPTAWPSPTPTAPAPRRDPASPTPDPDD
jgi:hypothetical protein